MNSNVMSVSMNCANGWAPKIGQDPPAKRTIGHPTLAECAPESCQAILRCFQPLSRHSVGLVSIVIRLDLKRKNIHHDVTIIIRNRKRNSMPVT